MSTNKTVNWHILTEFRTQGVIKITLGENSTESDAMRIVFNMGHIPMRALDTNEEEDHNKYISEMQREYLELQKLKGGKNETSKNEKASELSR